jgi:BirA family transcriptional regulator, biotin operon repressor / biotin---[acetyl-CoA-carboxylase] ligase
MGKSISIRNKIVNAMDLNCLINYNLLHFESIDSTNAEAMRLAKAGVTGNVLIVADRQTNGRGQRGRKWVSLPGNLHMSIMLETDKNLRQLSQLTFLTANVLAETIASFTNNLDVEVELKWPNDVLINGKKVAGILLESIKFGGNQYVVIGIGVNVSNKPMIENRVVSSLKESINFDQRVEDLMNRLIKKFDQCYFEWERDESFYNIRSKWLSRAHNLSKIVTVDNGEGRISGLFKGIDEEGSIILELAGGQISKLNYGEVVPIIKSQ